MPLRDLQRSFVANVLFDNDATIRDRIQPGRFAAERHLQIYRNNVYASLSGALEALYPVVARLVGADCFRGCAYAYIRHTPPMSGNLHDFGDRFAAFLGTYDPVQSLAYLPDVARLEWSWHCAFHAADAAPLALDALARVPADRYRALRFHLHPSVRLQTSDYPLLKIWRADQPDASGEERVDLQEGGVHLVVARRGLAVEIESVGAAEHALLCRFAEGRTLADAAQSAAATSTDFDLNTSLRRRVEDQTITGFGVDA